MNNRIFIQKKPIFDGHGRTIQNELVDICPNIQVKALIVYDIFELNEDQQNVVINEILSDAVQDVLWYNIDELVKENTVILATEYLPGQYDQRADWAIQASQLAGIQDLKVKSGFCYLLEGCNSQEFEEIKKYLINPIESREKNLDVLQYVENISVKSIELLVDFNTKTQEQLFDFHKSWGLSMGLDDLTFIQEYFSKLNRNPRETEIKVLDTYWSDHCRHTTFETELTNIKFESQFNALIKKSFERYLELRKELKIQKPIRLMDLATIMGKYLSKSGKITNIDISEEINACSIVVPIKTEEGSEDWLVQFKNETHNHPTEVEPFGGAATCVGGAIRDPLAGRAFVYQAMRVSGSANPLEKLEDTLEGKLPQRKISKLAAQGYSSYGNQIGLTTTHVRELFHPGYKAKRMEVGFVVGAVKKEYVRREEPKKGDLIVLLGGRTGRDGVGGATGSSKTHDGQKLEELSAEVQKGNAVTERKIQRLFKNPEVLQKIKRCNDFGAGGVSVAIGEIAESIDIDLDKIKTKYNGLNGTELALSESQERMAIVIDAQDYDSIITLAETENLEATAVAEVTDTGKMRMFWKKELLVELDRSFLDTGGIRKSQQVTVIDSEKDTPFKSPEFNKESFLNQLKSLPHASQKGLIERFDSNIGRGTVLMPFGGKYQLSPEDVSAQRIIAKASTKASVAAFGFEPKISEWSPYHGAYYAVIENVTKLVAAGARIQDIRLSFQEYFERLGYKAERWGKPLAALLGALEAQSNLGIPAIGGKDSMSGSYQDIDVPPTLISFGLAPVEIENIRSVGLDNSSTNLFAFIPTQNPEELIDRKVLFEFEAELNKVKLQACSSIKFGGIAETLALMSFGNKVGIEAQTNLDLMRPYPGGIIFATNEEITSDELNKHLFKLGNTNNSNSLNFNGISFEIEDLIRSWSRTFEAVFPATDKSKISTEFTIPQKKFTVNLATNKTANPRVFIPVFPGTNCEYDSQIAFEKEGASTKIEVFKNLSKERIKESIDTFCDELDNSQILFLPGGFSAADEPEGSGKFIATLLRNEKIIDAISKHLAQDGLVLGICNGFQALVKSGLLPYGKPQKLTTSSPTLTYNRIGRHVSQMVKVRVNPNPSPWLANMQGEEFWIPVSHGEGQFVAKDELLEDLFNNNQIATQYIDESGKLADSMPYNPNGSVCGIEGIVSADGKIFGRMGHPERYESGLMKNIPDVEYMNIFANGVNYFK